MALRPVPTSWEDEILDAAREMFNGELEVWTAGTPGEYDSTTDSTSGGTPATLVLSRRPARAQQIRLPESSNDGNGWQPKRRYRFQCEILPDDPSVTKGLIVKFFGGRDPEVAKMTYHVDWATNSSHAALRTIETTTEGGRG